MGAYDNVGSILAGGTPQFAFDPNALTLPQQPAIDPRIGVGPVQQSGPAQVVTPMGQVNAGMNKLGTIMNKPGVAQALAMAGQLGTGMGGRGLLAHDISALATKLAAGKGVGVGTQPTLPGLVPNQPAQQQQQPAQQQQVSQTAPTAGPTTSVTMKYDLDGDGNVTYNEIKKVNESGPLTRVGAEVQGNPMVGAGNQAGMPVAATQSPARDLSRNDNLMMLSGLTNPDFALEVAKQEPIAMNAAAQMMEAQNKRALLPYEQAHKQALSNDLTAKLYGMFSYSPQAQGLVEQAKAQGTARGQQIVVEDFAASPAGLMPVPKEMIGVVPGVVPGMTMGDLARQSGSLKGLHDYVKLYTDTIIARGHDRARMGAAAIGAGAVDRATIGQQVTALTNLNATFDREQRLIAGQIKELTDPANTMLLTPKEKAANLVTVENLRSQLAEISDSKNRTVKALTTIGGVDVGATTPAPAVDTTKPQTFNSEATALEYAKKLGKGNFTANKVGDTIVITPKKLNSVVPTTPTKAPTPGGAKSMEFRGAPPAKASMDFVSEAPAGSTGLGATRRKRIYKMEDYL